MNDASFGLVLRGGKVSSPYPGSEKAQIKYIYALSTQAQSVWIHKLSRSISNCELEICKYNRIILMGNII